MKANDLIEVKSNVSIAVRERGKIVDRRESHNVFVNQGRQWLRDLIGAGVYPADDGNANRNLTSDGGVSQNADTYATGSINKTYRVRWVGVGVSGAKQNDSPSRYRGPSRRGLYNAVGVPG